MVDNILMILKNKNNEKVLIDHTGSIISIDSSQNVIASDSDFIIFSSDDLMGARHISGKICIPPKYQRLFYVKNNFYAIFDTNTFIFNNKGLLIKTLHFEILESSDSLFLAKKHEKWGCVDYSGKIIVSFLYDDIEPFSNGFAAVKKNGLWGYVDQSGQLRIPFKYSFVNSFNRKGLALVNYHEEPCFEPTIEPNWGYIDVWGNEYWDN